jgi:8-oxo-dGTP pyrophosphatase MutT (NUDIX family)
MTSARSVSPHSRSGAPGTGRELPGCGIDPGETHLEAGVRELREEIGFIVTPSQFGRANRQRRATFVHRRMRHLQDEVVVAVRLDGCGLTIDESHRLHYEREDYFRFRWWPVSDIVRSQERFYPGRLPELLAAFLADIHEPFELWS